MNKKTQTLDESIDASLDGFFDWMRHNLIAVLLFAAIVAVFFIWALPTIDQWGQTALGVGITILQVLFSIAVGLLQFVALFWFLGRGRTYWVKPGETGVSFDDYKGNPEVVEAARRIVVLMQGVKDFKDMGGEVSRGLLLVGPPGTGKSYLAQCISTEAGVPFGYASAPSFQSMFFGVGNLKIMMLYSKARKLARKYGGCILFMDEIDAIGMSRSRQGPLGGGGGMFGGNTGMLNELLLQMDPPPQELGWFKKLLRTIGLRKTVVKNPPVLTVAATNLAEVLDPALLRPGRFDRMISVHAPDTAGREEVIRYYLDKVRHEDMPIHRLVSDTIGYTPVAIKHVINEAVIHAHFNQRQAINYRDFAIALETHEHGLREPIKNLSPLEKRRLAYHEAGHAIAAYFLLDRHMISRATIIRHGGAGGFVAWKPKEEIYTQTREDVLARIQVALASRAAEEMFLGIAMTGVTSDLQSATEMAAMYVGIYGMENNFYSMQAFGEIVPDGEMKAKINELLREQYGEVKVLLIKHRAAVIAVAEALIECDELDLLEITEIINRAERQPDLVSIGSTTYSRNEDGQLIIGDGNGGNTSIVPNDLPLQQPAD